MEEKIVFHDTVVMFQNESQFNNFVKFFCRESEMPDYLTWKTTTEKRLLEASKNGENLIKINPRFELLLEWIKNHPYATEEEVMAKLVTAIV